MYVAIKIRVGKTCFRATKRRDSQSKFGGDQYVAHLFGRTDRRARAAFRDGTPQLPAADRAEDTRLQRTHTERSDAKSKDRTL